MRCLRLCSPLVQCLGTGTKWCCVQTLSTRYVGVFRFNKPSTCGRVRESHHACVRCSIYPLDYCFLRFLYLFYVVFLYETLKRPNGLRRQATISADCHGNVRCHFKKIESLFCFVQVKCKLKCYFKPMNNPLGVSPSKGKQGTTRGKEKIF